jgi:hypothetical protein
MSHPQTAAGEQPMNTCKYIAFLVTVLLAGCGGGGGSSGSGSSSMGDPVTYDIQSTWSGSYSISGEPADVPVTAVIAQSGYGFFYDSNGDVYVLPTLDGGPILSGTLTAYAPKGTTFPDGKATEQFQVTGSVSNTTISGTFSGNGETGSFSLATFTSFTGTPSIIAGQWQGYYVGTTSSAVDITMNTNGSFTGSDADGCTISGSLTEIQSTNIFQVSVNSVGAGCAGQLSGLAFESSSDYNNLFGGAMGTYYYVGASNANSAFVAAFLVQ